MVIVVLLFLSAGLCELFSNGPLLETFLFTPKA